ncbi:MAG: hypothetical protein CM15mP121_2410 [Bacteroidota bacterium]|nr:MAG: hypothetical protein CM15mP121_2410 [Bacteroidota bacterium]
MICPYPNHPLRGANFLTPFLIRDIFTVFSNNNKKFYRNIFFFLKGFYILTVYKSKKIKFKLIRLMEKEKLHSYTNLNKRVFIREPIIFFPQERMMLLKDYLEFNYFLSAK